MKGGCPAGIAFHTEGENFAMPGYDLLANCLTPILTVTISGIGIARGIVSDSTFKELLEFPDPLLR
jgi:hypothetical protein